MKIEMSHIPRKKDDNNIVDYIKIRDTLKSVFENNINQLLPYYDLPSEHILFLRTCMLLEEASLIHKKINPKYTLRYTINEYFLEDSAYSGDFKIRVQKGPKNDWLPFDDRIQRLTGMEVVMTQNSHHFIRIGLEDKVLNVYTNQTLSWDNLYKLKRMQYQIFKEYYTECDPALFDFFDALIADDLVKAQNALDCILNNPELKRMSFDFLEKHFTSDKERLIALYEERIEKNRKQIDDLQNRLATIISCLKEDTLQYHALLTTQDDFDIETIIHYLMNHPYIENITENTSKDTLTLYYKAPLLYYDDSFLDPLINSATDPTREAILKILKERKYVIWTKCAIKYKPEQFWITPHTNSVRCETNTIPHPHIDYYGCLGNHTDAINNWKETGDYIGCIDQITAAVLNLNVIDGAVMNVLIETIERHKSCKCFQNNETKEFVSFNDILKEKETNGETQTE